MSLIKCYECSKEISDRAKSCPHCGAPKKEVIFKDVTQQNHNKAVVTNPLKLKIMENSTQPSSYNNFRDNLILFCLVLMVLTDLYWILSPSIFEYFFPELIWWDSLVWKITFPIYQLIWAIIPLGLAFAVLNKNIRLIAIIIGGVYLLACLIELVLNIY